MIGQIRSTRMVLATAGLLLTGSASLAQANDAGGFSLDLGRALALGVAGQVADEPAASDDVVPERTPPVEFGSESSRWWSVSGSGMADEDNRDYSLRFTYHHFLAQDFEWNIGLTGWYHDQPDHDEWSGSVDVGFRYHFLVDAQDRDWSVYADVGIGLMLSTGEVPEEGTDYNFTPRAGLGVTMRLPEDFGGAQGGRLDLGLGWQHYSNASTSGSGENPARDSIQFRAGVMFPF